MRAIKIKSLGRYIDTDSGIIFMLFRGIVDNSKVYFYRRNGRKLIIDFNNKHQKYED